MGSQAWRDDTMVDFLDRLAGLADAEGKVQLRYDELLERLELSDGIVRVRRRHAIERGLLIVTKHSTFAGREPNTYQVLVTGGEWLRLLELERVASRVRQIKHARQRGEIATAVREDRPAPREKSVEAEVEAELHALDKAAMVELDVDLDADMTPDDVDAWAV